MGTVYYLSHGGPGSGRYPWGSGDRPYQRLEGSRRRSSGISGYIKARKEKKAEIQQQKAKVAKEKQQAEEKRENERLAADKERVLRSGTATEVMKYQGKLTNQELNSAAERIKLENQLRSYSEKDVKTALDKLKKVQNYTNVSSALAKDGIEIWNSFAAVYNATPDGQKKPLPFIAKGGGSGGDKRK